MKYLFYSSIFICFLSCKSSDEIIEEKANCIGDYSTENVLTNINEEIFNNDESVNTYSRYSWTSNGESRILRGNGIPNHEVGTFPNSGNPNRIREQSVNKNFTLCPSVISENGLDVVGPAMVIAYALNSVKFDPATAGRCNDAGVCSLAQGNGNWNIEALGHETFDFGDDMNHAHVQPNGAYHYHGIPELLVEFLGDKQGMTIVGWASDGRPMVLTTLIGGPSQGTTNPNTQIPMGAFTQDYEYVDGLGDLDRCNGRYGVTPEFPDGIYYYVVTDDFPFFTRCLKGDV